MKKGFLFSVLSALLILCFASIAHAERVMINDISLIVPSGWTLVESDGNVGLVNNDHSADIIIITTRAPSSTNKKQFAINIADEFGGATPKYDKGSGGYYFTFSDEGKENRAWVNVYDKAMGVVLVMKGYDPQMMEIAKTIQFTRG